MKLRDYQIKAIEDCYQQWSQGQKNVMLQLPTGAGKTVIFSHIISNHLEPCVAIVHRLELVSQISVMLARYKIKHKIIGQPQVIRNIIALHLSEVGQNFIDQNSMHTVAAVDTLIRLDNNQPWFKKVSFVVQDEGHHVLKENKWGKAAALFPNARGLYPTATPTRADGKGLGRNADGIIDALVTGPKMRDLITAGHLSDYRIFAPPSDLDLSNVAITSSGDFSPQRLRTATKKSHIVGDVVQHYLKFAKGLLGITFAVSVEASTEIAAEFRKYGVPAEVISSKTPDLLRAQIMRRFRNREILQLVNVDILGEGVDVPAVECVSFARATASYALFCQNFGRCLRPLKGKIKAIIIDHVGNVARHGLPDKSRTWSLERRERKSSNIVSEIKLKTCLNTSCFAVYESKYKACPECGLYTPPAQRSTPEQVDGDLTELDPDILSLLRGEIARIDGVAHPPKHLSQIAQLGVINKHAARQDAQKLLRDRIAEWAGVQHQNGAIDSEIYREFYALYGVDIMTAQTLSAREAEELCSKIRTG